MSIFFMLAYRRCTSAPNSVLVELFGILRSRGLKVDVGVAEELLLETEYMPVAYDLYVLKSHSELWLSLAGVLHNQGARVLNPYSCCLAARDKIVASERLRTANIPTPRSWLTGNLIQLRHVVTELPLVVKPYIGGRGKDVHIVRHPDELAALPPNQRQWLVQELIPGPGEDLKVYVIGNEVFGLRKPSTPTSSRTSGRPCAVSSEVRDIALRCGQALGLSLYGVDVIESPDGPVVVDVNYFPSYKEVPNAAGRLADYIEGYARGRSPEPPAPWLQSTDSRSAAQSKWSVAPVLKGALSNG